MDPASETSVAVAFGRFLVRPHRRELLADGQPVKLGGRAFDVLLALIEARGAVITKDALMTRVWPDRIVEENALQGQISALRMALGADRDLVRTVSGRGYQFIGEVRPMPSADDNAGADAVATKPASVVPMTNLPEPLSELIGRDDEIGEALNLAAAHRLVTLTGAGGIGKTRIALALARELLPHFADGVWVAEFSPLSDPGLVPATVAAALGLEPGGGEISVQRVAQMLTARRLLLVLDTCEHVIEATAALAEAVLRAGSTVHILATSREPLQVEGEWIFPVPPLAVPVENADSQDDPLQYGAVRLFIERARAAVPHFAPDRRDVALIAAICRRLDGIPLAIELAASRVAMLGIEELATRLEDRLQLLTSGRRTALPRHRTLRATLDWSYELLAEPERVLLRRLAIFAGPFSLEAACAVAVGPELAESDVIDVISSLLTKSLVITATGGGIARYRLLDTTRAYAIEKRDESAERDPIARRHAEYYRELLEIAATGAAPGILAAGFAAEINNIRAALVWAFSDGGNPSIAIALASASAQLLLELSLLADCQKWTSKALALLSPEENGTRREMVLQVASAISSRFTTGTTEEEVHSRLTRALELAEQFNDADYKLRILHVHCSCYAWRGDLRAALAIARQCEAFAASVTDPFAQPMADRMLGIVQFYLGDLTSARAHLERALDRFPRRNDLLRFGADPRLVALSHKSDILWLQGLADQALQLARTSLDEARTLGHLLAQCNALVSLAIISIRVGDIEKSASWIEELRDQAEKHALNAYNPCAVGLAGQLSAMRNDNATAVRLLRTALDRSPRGSFTYYALYTMFAADLALAEAKTGELGRGLAVIDETLQRIERNEEWWHLPETLRIKGELLLLQSEPGAAAAAEDHFRQALDRASQQGELSWELRAAMSLARLLGDQGRSVVAITCLQPIYDRFTEGFDTADLKSAKALL